ncbi:hypothetical protein ABZ845_14320 [Streptomyces sp. NPDC047022]|uniref:GAF domain-containing protein n=1 Tax=Streptomyces sp. NPDC047022 TaxID=3155737 RepID=UPI0033E6B33D
MDEFDVDAELQRALDRLALLAEVTKALGSTLDADEGLRRLCRIVVPQLADWCAVDLLEGGDGDGEQLRRVCVTHRDPALLPSGLLEGCLPVVPDEATGPWPACSEGLDRCFCVGPGRRGSTRNPCGSGTSWSSWTRPPRSSRPCGPAVA